MWTCEIFYFLFGSKFIWKTCQRHCFLKLILHFCILEILKIFTWLKTDHSTLSNAFLHVKTKECIELVNYNNPIILKACLQGFHITNFQGSWHLITFYDSHTIFLFCLSFLEYTFILFLKLPGKTLNNKRIMFV